MIEPTSNIINNQHKLVLGLDLGTTSIGWALIDEQNFRIINAGVRIFPEPLEPKTKAPLNQKRREARSSRRQRRRRKYRYQKLKSILTENKLLPIDEETSFKILHNKYENKDFNPYRLRSKAVVEKLELFEIGRILFHLGQRRGFMSNAGISLIETLKFNKEFESWYKNGNVEYSDSLNADVTSKSNEKEDESIIKKEINTLFNQMKNLGSKTLGDYLYSIESKTPTNIVIAGIKFKSKEAVRRKFTHRSMYEDEFNKIWELQSQFYTDILTIDLKKSLYKIIFFQNPLKSQKQLIGNCSLEKGRKCCHKARLEFQEFEIWQKINNLRILSSTNRTQRELDLNEKTILFKELNSKQKLTWTQVRKLLKLTSREKFNFEGDEDKDIKGNKTRYILKKIFGEFWFQELNKPEELIEDIITIEKKYLYKRLRKHYKFSIDQAGKLLTEIFPKDYASYSLKAINKLLPYLREGKSLFDAKKLVGYINLDTNQENNKISQNLDLLDDPPYLRNPAVQRALNQTKRLINAIIKKYQKPDVIRIELTRDLKLTKKQKEIQSKKNNENKKNNDLAVKLIKENNFENNKTNILKYKLWVESNKICPYTGQAIGINQLFSPEVNIEHIIPYSRCLDDSFANKTICLAEHNQQVKKQQTPLEAYGHDKTLFDEIIQRVPFRKRKKFQSEIESLDIENSRLLNDTKYISKSVSSYLGKLNVKIETTKGKITNLLSKNWNLYAFLDLPSVKRDNPNVKTSFMDKVRSDHKHHAIDAISIALTSPKIVHNLSTLSGRGLNIKQEKLPYPWESFREDVKEKLDRMIISHAPNRKITGAFHEETAYGLLTNEQKNIDSSNYINVKYRKGVKILTDPEMLRIIDPTLKSIINNTDKKEIDNLPFKKVKLQVKKNKSSVWIVNTDKNEPSKLYSLGNNHHVEVIEKNNKWNYIFVTAKEAAYRARIEKKSVVQKKHLDATFIMSLCRNDLVKLETDDGNVSIYRIKKMSIANNNITLIKHSSAGDNGQFNLSASSFQTEKAIKLNINFLGEVFECKND